MKGQVILSHGLESGPEATKVSAMAEVARELGWREVRPDFRDLDATGDARRIDDRVARVLEQVRADGGPLVLAGSSMGSFASGLASLRAACVGLFLLAPPLAIEGYPRRFDCARVPTEIVHGWDDELIPAADVIAFAQARCAILHLVDDSHRLSAHVATVAQWFRRFLAALT
jgi:predicted alpha/beta-hydrolase family hydrolase